MTVINASAYADLNDAAAGAVAGDIIYIDADTEVVANLTIPARVPVLRERWARVHAADTSVSLTILDELEAGRLQLLEGFGVGKVSLSNQTLALPEWWGVRDGSGTDDIAINNAILAAMHIGLIGDYFCASKVLSPYGGYQGFRKRIVALAGRARLFANTPGMTLFHHADSYAKIKGLDLHANAQDVTLFKLMPELEENNTAVANQNHNEIDVDFFGGDGGMIMMAGRPIGGQASGCWYNRIKHNATSCDRVMWLKDNGSTDILSSGSNSNLIEGIHNGSIIDGVVIDAGGGNLVRVQQENLSGTGIKVGVASRNGLMINGGDNPNNMIHDWHGENVAIHAEINVASTKFFNSDLDHLRVTGNARETFLDDGKTRYKVPTLVPDAGGSIGLTPNSYVSYQETHGRMFVEGYYQVDEIIGSPTGVLHSPGIAKPCLPGTAHRSSGSAQFNSLISGSGAASTDCRILEGDLNPNGIIDFFGANDGNLKYLAPYIQAGSTINFSINYPVR